MSVFSSLAGIYVSSYHYICVLMLLCVSSYYYVCVLILRYTCAHTTICVSSYYMCPHTTIYVSSSYYICVLILLHMCPHPTIFVARSGGRERRHIETSSASFLTYAAVCGRMWQDAAAENAGIYRDVFGVVPDVCCRMRPYVAGRGGKKRRHI